MNQNLVMDLARLARVEARHAQDPRERGHLLIMGHWLDEQAFSSPVDDAVRLARTIIAGPTPPVPTGVPVAPTPDVSKNPALDALTTITSKDLQADLSPPVLALAQGIDYGAGLALGLGKTVSEASADAIGNIAGDVAAEIAGTVGDIANVVPAIGQVISFAVKALGFLFKGHEAEDTADCQLMFRVFAPKGTGSLLAGGASVPADLFARIHKPRIVDKYAGEEIDAPYDVAQIGPGDEKYRSAYGMALMQITEGFPIDPRDFSDARAKSLIDEYDLDRFKGGNDFRRALQVCIDRDAGDIAPRQWKILFPSGVAKGLPDAWRARFRTLRRGIEHTHKRKGSDGGVAFWVVYMDLLAAAVRKKYLSWNYVQWLFQRGSEYYFATGSDKTAPGVDITTVFGKGSILRDRLYGASDDPQGKKLSAGDIVFRPLLAVKQAAPSFAPFVDAWGRYPCPSMVTNMIRPNVESWENTIHPFYGQGKSAVADLKRKAKEAAISKREPAADNRPQATLVNSIAEGLRALFGGGS